MRVRRPNWWPRIHPRYSEHGQDLPTPVVGEKISNYIPTLQQTQKRNIRETGMTRGSVTPGRKR